MSAAQTALSTLQQNGKSGGRLQTDAGSTFVRVIGCGPPVFVVHGGPGFDHRYLVGPLEFLAERRSLIFFDQPGCGETPTPEQGPSLDHTIDHFRALFRSLAVGRSVGIIAHSWGALVAVAAFGSEQEGHAPAPDLIEGVLINPVAIHTEAYDDAYQRLLARLPSDVLQQVAQILTAGGDGAEAMRLLMPHYRSRDFAVPVEEFPLAAATYSVVVSQLGAFDYRAGLACCANLTMLVGADDFTGLDLLGDLQANCRETVVMPDIGHFPFFEDPASFRQIVERVLQ